MPQSQPDRVRVAAEVTHRSASYAVVDTVEDGVIRSELTAHKESPTWGTGRAELDGSAELGGSPTENLITLSNCSS